MDTEQDRDRRAGGNNARMTKSELIERMVARQPQLGYRDVELAVKTILEHMAQTLASGERIEIRGFGSFSLHYRPPRVGRNPKSGEPVSLPAKYVPHFKPGKELRERVNARLDLVRGARGQERTDAEESRADTA